MKQPWVFSCSRLARRILRCNPLLALLVLAACGKAEIKPVAIVTEDMCAQCRMAISEQRYAAELVRKDGDAVKFDDIGCMIHYVEARQERSDTAAYFVADFDSQEWTNAEQAFFLESIAFKTPMRGGIVAFKEKSRGDEAVRRYDGKLLRFADLFRERLRGS